MFYYITGRQMRLAQCDGDDRSVNMKFAVCFVLFIAIAFTTAGKAPCIELNDGTMMPVVALGTGRGTAKESDSVDEVRQAVYWAIEAGYRHIDTAAIYDDEPQVGQGIAEAIAKGLVKREELFVTTKVFSNKLREVLPSLQESLSKLGLAYVDLYLIHFPIAVKEDNTYDDYDYLDAWKSMEQAQALGLTRTIGVSNFNATQLDRLIANSKVRPVVNEVEVNPTLTQIELVRHCQEQAVAVMAYSPFGFLVSRDSANAPPPRLDDPVLVAMAQKYGKTTSQIVLRYLIERGLTPIPKSVNQKRIKQNIDIFDFSLTPDEVAQINRFNKNVRVIDFADWKSYPNFPFVEY